MNEMYDLFINTDIEKSIKFFISLAVFVACVRIVYIIVRKITISNQIRKLADNSLEMTPEEFFRMRNTSFGGRGRKLYALTKNFEGVYILYNETQNMYYVGQAKQVLNRVNSHFTGKGNGDVYADYKYGDEFTIRMVALDNTNFSSLNELERHMIEYYNAFSSGYNKTRGNR